MTATTTETIYMHGKERNFTAEEYFALSDEMWAAKRRGDMETYKRISGMLPVEPYAAKAFKEVYGKDYLLSLGADLTEANYRYGEGWLDEPNGR